MDPDNTTDPLDADTDDDGITDGNEDANHNGVRDEGETAPEFWDTDNDILPDGLEIGLTEPQHDDTDMNEFLADTDPATTTDPTNPDSDGDGLLDGQEDFTRDGAVNSTEPDPNDWDSDDDGLADGSGNTVTVLTLTHVVSTAANDMEIYLWVNGTRLPHVGYRAPDAGKWNIIADNTTWLNETIAVAFFLNRMPIVVHDGFVIDFAWLPNIEGAFNVEAGPSLILWFNTQKVNYTFPDPDPAVNDTDGDGLTDFFEAMYLSGRVRDFRVNNTDNDTENKTLLDGSVVFNNLVDPDSDNDGVPDGEEWGNNSDMLVVDTEGDGLSDFQELREYGTNPCDPDTDWDGLTDYEEVYRALDKIITDPCDNDTDNDNLLDGWRDINHNLTFDSGEEWGETGDLAQPIAGENRNEGGYGTNASLTDTDFDGLDDGDELSLLWQPVWDATHTNNQLTDIGWNSDPDGDNLYNLIDLDSDNDGILDGPEKLMWESYPNITAPGWDQNSDSYDSWDKLINIIDPDSDNEGLTDGEEMLTFFTRSDNRDTDGDAYGYADYWVEGQRFRGQNYNFNDYTEIDYWMNTKEYNFTVAGQYAKNFDVDNDTMKDGWEKYYTLHPDNNTGDHGANGDYDWDGLTNIQEYITGYNLIPNDNDTDNDGLYDGWGDTNHNTTYDTDEIWGEVGDPENGFAGGYGTYPNDWDSDNDAYGNPEYDNPWVFYDGNEISYWINNGYSQSMAGQYARGTNADVDGDGMLDGWEVYYGLLPDNNVGINGAAEDLEDDGAGDGLTNKQEHDGWNVIIDIRKSPYPYTYLVRSDPTIADYDGDTFKDYWERLRGLNPYMLDTDEDGLSDDAEINTWGTLANDPDCDNDGLTDGYEINNFGNNDIDGDGLNNPWDPDSDGDTLWDGWHDDVGSWSNNLLWNTEESWGELGDPNNNFNGGYGTNPALADTDNDNFQDGEELNYWNTIPGVDWDDDTNIDGEINLLDDDSDGDGLDDGDEVKTYETHPYDDDTDGDDLNDYTEVTTLYSIIHDFESRVPHWDPYSGISKWELTTATSHSSSYSWHAGGWVAKGNYLYSPTIGFGCLDTTISFWYKLSRVAADSGIAQIYLKLDDGSTRIIGSNLPTVSSWTEISFPISGLKGHTGYFEFYFYSFQTGDHWYIDDIVTQGRTNPNGKDTDHDDIEDWDELNTHLTSPIDPDTDGDGSYDGVETLFETSPITTETTLLITVDNVDPSSALWIFIVNGIYINSNPIALIYPYDGETTSFHLWAYYIPTLIVMFDAVVTLPGDTLHATVSSLLFNLEISGNVQFSESYEPTWAPLARELAPHQYYEDMTQEFPTSMFFDGDTIMYNNGVPGTYPDGSSRTDVSGPTGYYVEDTNADSNPTDGWTDTQRITELTAVYLQGFQQGNLIGIQYWFYYPLHDDPGQSAHQHDWWYFWIVYDMSNHKPYQVVYDFHHNLRAEFFTDGRVQRSGFHVKTYHDASGHRVMWDAGSQPSTLDKLYLYVGWTLFDVLEGRGYPIFTARNVPPGDKIFGTMIEYLKNSGTIADWRNSNSDWNMGIQLNVENFNRWIWIYDGNLERRASVLGTVSYKVGFTGDHVLEHDIWPSKYQQADYSLKWSYLPWSEEAQYSSIDRDGDGIDDSYISSARGVWEWKPFSPEYPISPTTYTTYYDGSGT